LSSEVKRLKEEKYFLGIAIAALILFITYLHYSTAHGILSLHGIYRELYFIPLLFGALRFGLKGTLITFLCITVLYVPYIFMSWTGAFISELNRLLDILILGLFAFLAGFLIDRDRRRREQLQRERYLANIGQVAATIVHDLKNPLITILGFAKRIQAGKGNADSAVQEIIDSAEDMQKVVHDVLDFTKPVALELKEENMRNLITRVRDSCKTKAEEKGISLSIDLPVDSIRTAIDSFHMGRALVNLVNNAIEASDKGQDVRISANAGKNMLFIKIKDQGSGMDRETRENIFIPFYTRKSGGTGLGMAIAKKIVDAHKGEISIKSQPRLGTEVTIRLPYR
jgi:two-component system, NtrC family, sensor histidine kinase HydH